MTQWLDITLLWLVVLSILLAYQYSYMYTRAFGHRYQGLDKQPYATLYVFVVVYNLYVGIKTTFLMLQMIDFYGSVETLSLLIFLAETIIIIILFLISLIEAYLAGYLRVDNIKPWQVWLTIGLVFILISAFVLVELTLHYTI